MDISEEKSGTLRSEAHGHSPVVYGISPYASHAMLSDNPKSGIYEARTARTLDLNGGNNTPMVMSYQGFADYKESDAASTCKERDYKDATDLVISFTTEMTPKVDGSGIAFSLRERDHKDAQSVVYGLDRASFNQGANAKYDFSIQEEVAQTIVSQGPGGL